MSDQSASKKSSFSVKNWAVIITAVSSIIAIVPPLISAMRSNPSVSVSGTGNTSNVGSTVNSNNSIVNNYFSSWVDGVQKLTGLGGNPAAISSSTPTLVAQPTSTAQTSPSTVDAEPEPGAVGRLVVNPSLINDATWTTEPSRVNRLLTFSFHVEAASNGNKVGSLDTTLFREGKDICTISLNTKTSPLSGGVRLDNAVCYDTLASNSGATYRAKVKASEMTPVKIVLNYVDAVKK
jgi:hypothetical protein